MSDTSFLSKVADVLEAVAHEKEKLAAELNSIKQDKRKELLNPLVEKLSFLDVDANQEELVAKLSSLDEGTLSIINKIAGSEAPQLGGSAKLASLNQNDNNADNSFASWILS